VAVEHAAVPAATGGLWRVEADGIPYVVKRLRRGGAGGHALWPASDDPDDPMWWRREADAYASVLLPDGDLRAPRCAWIDDRGDEVELWLEDVDGDPATSWPLERYGPAARALGRWQGEYLAGRPLPDDRWLSRGWLRAYVERRAGDFAAGDAPPRAQRVWDERAAFLDAVDRAPRTLCHLDFWPRNLFADGGRTVAIDWAFAGVGAAGEDAGNLVPDAVLDGFLPGPAVRELHDLVWHEYLAGLADAGARVDERAVRLAFCASAAVKYAWLEPRMLRAGAAPEVWEQRAATLDLLEELAAEARRLA
jgi:hypothetical protein